MRRLLPCALGVAILLIGAGAGNALPLGSISLEVSGITPGSGRLMIALYNGAESFEGEAEPVRFKRLAATGDRMFIPFDGLTPGYYAIAAYQDINGNGQLDRTANGVPAEPVGYSNNAADRRGRPEFRAAAFQVNAADIPVKIRLIERSKPR